MGDTQTDQESIRPDLLQAITTGSDLVGASAGAAIGLLGGPPGIIAGAAGGVLITRSLKQVGERVIARFTWSRERARVGGAIAVATEEIARRLEKGDHLRADGFLDVDPSGSGSEAAEEILEGVLRHAADAYEEKKVLYLGLFYTNLAFDETFEPAEAHHLLKVYERLTHRGVVILAAMAERGFSTALSEAQLGWIARGRTTDPSSQIMAEVDELANLNLIGVVQEDGSVVNRMGVYGGGSLAHLGLAKTGLLPLGRRLSQSFELSKVPLRERDQMLATLAGGGRPL